MSNFVEKQPGDTFGEFTIISTLGKGSFGVVYIAEGKGKKMALKTSTSPKDNTMFYESLVMRNFLKGPGIPQFYACGRIGEQWYLATELLGKSLGTLQNECGGTFSPYSVARIGLQVLQRLALIHKAGFIYRDIKPDNLLIGLPPDTEMIYLIDFGCVCKINPEETKKKAKYNQVGTPRFAAVGVHQCYAATRHSDAESLGYVLLYLLYGSLPWQGLGCASKDLWKKIGEIKEQISIPDLAKGNTMMEKYFQYIRTCPDQIDLSILEALCRESMEAEPNKHPFEWQQPSKVMEKEKEASTILPKSEPLEGLNKLTVVQLRQELKRQNKPSKGTKKELIARLLEQ